MSSFKVEVVPVKLRKHPNADSLSICDVRGWQVVVKTEDFKDKEAAVYIPVDALLPELPQFEFMRSRKFRVKAIKLRGEMSVGLLLPLKEFPNLDLKIGDDITSTLGITKWEPYKNPQSHEFKLKGRITKKVIEGFYKFTDIEHSRNHTDTIQLLGCNEVEFSEKIHGANFRAGYVDGQFLVGSHNEIRTESDKDSWVTISKKLDLERKILECWTIEKNNLESDLVFNFTGNATLKDIFFDLLDFKWNIVYKLIKLEWGRNLINRLLKPNIIFYGELYGPGVQKGFDYGRKDHGVIFYDISIDGNYCNPETTKFIIGELELEYVPVIDHWYREPITQEVLVSLMSKASPLAEKNKVLYNGKTNIQEGIVIRPLIPRTYGSKGHNQRWIFKYVSDTYLLKKEEDSIGH